MDKNLLKYVNHESNIYVGKLKLTRDVAPNGMEHVRVCTPPDPGGDEKEMYQYWHNPRGKEKNDKPKHTGGKKPYLMLMINEIDKFCESVPGMEELLGYVVRLGKYIEWNTGRLINPKSKEPLKYTDLIKIFKCSKPKLNKMISIMKEYEILYHTGEGYYISSRFVKKGKMQKKEDTRDVL